MADLRVDSVLDTVASDAVVLDAVVIGAGISGLVAARRLVAAGAEVIVLEASGRVGGRLLTRTLEDGAAFDLGGQWISEDMPLVCALVEEFGLRTFAQHDSGRIDLATQPLSAMDQLVQAEWEWVRAKLSVLVSRVDVDAPSATPDADQLDGTSVEEWKRNNLESEYLRHLFDQVIRTEFTIEPKDFSMLHFLHSLACSGGPDTIFRADRGNESHRVVEGLQPLTTAIAAQLGGRVRLGCQVYDVNTTDEGVEVVAEGCTVRARRVIVAIPPNQVVRIDFDPVLPRRRSRLMQRLEMGAVIKCFALYDRPFWRDRAPNPIDPDDLIFDDTIDATSHDGRQPALVAFIGGDDAVVWSDRPPEIRRRAVLEDLALVFGEEALYPVRYFDHDWLTERFIGGGYQCYAPPGVMSAGFEELPLPIGRIHWAGTETAKTFYGYIEGAIEAGVRAAGEVLDAERPTADPPLFDGVRP